MDLRGFAQLTQQDCSQWIARMAEKPGSFHTESQGSQDWILDTIFEKIGTVHKKSVEFGYGYSKVPRTPEDMAAARLNTLALQKKGWNTMYFDAAVGAPDLRIFQATLTQDNIADIFREHGVPQDVDYVSIDVDSVDLWLLQGLLSAGYKPRVISVEYNANFPPGAEITFQQTWHPWTGRSVFGASAGALHRVATEHGFVPVHVMRNGMDIFFVQKAVLAPVCNMYTVPDFKKLASFLPFRMHSRCDAADSKRMVDLGLMRQGLTDQAHKKAVEVMRSLDMCEKDALT